MKDPAIQAAMRHRALENARQAQARARIFGADPKLKKEAVEMEIVKTKGKLERALVEAAFLKSQHEASARGVELQAKDAAVRLKFLKKALKKT